MPDEAPYMGQRIFGCHVPGIFAYANPWYLGLLVGSAVFNWAVSRVLAGEGNKETAKGNGKTPGRTDGKKSGRPGSRMVLVFGICANLALLFTLNTRISL